VRANTSLSSDSNADDILPHSRQSASIPTYAINSFERAILPAHFLEVGALPSPAGSLQLGQGIPPAARRDWLNSNPMRDPQTPDGVNDQAVRKTQLLAFLLWKRIQDTEAIEPRHLDV